MCRALKDRVCPSLLAKQDARELILEAWLGLDPKGPDRPPRRRSSSIIMLDWYDPEYGLSSSYYASLPYCLW